MERKDVVLAALAAGNGAIHTPVQVQKLFFLIDENISEHIGGPKFNFKPYDYGPFDNTVYEEIENLAKSGDAIVSFNGRWNNYQLTVDGLQKGRVLFEKIPPEARNYIKDVSNFILTHSFTEIVSAIYKAYPEMRENSVFQE